MVRKKLRRSVVLWAGAILAALLVIAVAIYMNGASRGQALDPDGGPATPSSAGEASPATPFTAPTPSPSPSLLSQSAVASIQAALHSGDDETVRQILPVAPGENLRSGFSATVADMDLVIDLQSQQVIDEGVWELVATDNQSDRWTLGLVSVEGLPRLIYAERASE